MYVFMLNVGFRIGRTPFLLVCLFIYLFICSYAVGFWKSWNKRKFIHRKTNWADWNLIFESFLLWVLLLLRCFIQFRQLWINNNIGIHYTISAPLYEGGMNCCLETVSERELCCELITLGRHLTYRRHHPMYHTLVLVLLSLRMRLFNGFIFRNTGWNVSLEG